MEDHRSAPRVSAWGLSLAAPCQLIVAVIPSAARGGPTAPTFASFVAPPSLGNEAGEPSIGSNWATGNVMYQAGLETLRVSGFNDATEAATWAGVGSTITDRA
jgi:hypothetical protein